MPSSRRDEPFPAANGGYATAAAIMVSLALALMATAISASAMQALHLAHADAERADTERELDNALTHVSAALLQAKQTARLRWTIPTSSGDVDVVAEPEAAKLSMEHVSELDSRVAFPLGGVKASLIPSTADAYSADFSTLLANPTWHACAATILSPWGGEKLRLTQSLAPTAGPVSWRSGEVWRLRVSLKGWSEDRIVRFTGDRNRPAATVRRRIGRDRQGGIECDSLLKPNQPA